MRRYDCHPASATWGARCGKSARRVLRGGTGTSGKTARPVPTHHKEKLFGDEVYSVFGDARDDVRNTGNCIALGLPIASIVYSMRVAEYGLRKLARTLHVRLTHTRRSCAIEFADWHNLITAIKNKIREVRNLPVGPRKQIQLEGYSSAADHCEYMKDIWRNNTAHTRKLYTLPEAIGAFERVRDFMQFLAKHFKPRRKN
jgi:hypothetical protein